MAETHQVITKVWIVPGCIVCDSCENDCPEVFDVREDTCVIRPPAMNAEFLKPITPSIITASEGCPVEVIKYEVVEVPGPAPWAGQEAAAAAAAPQGSVAAAAKVVAPLTPPDPKWQALLSTSRVSPSLSAGIGTTIRKSSEIIGAETAVAALNLEEKTADVSTQAKAKWKDAPPDFRMANLAAFGAYQPPVSMGQRLRNAAARAAEAAKVSRREFNMALVIAWGAIAACTLTFGAMFQDFFGPKVLKEPKKVFRVGRADEFANPGVYEQFKPDPYQFWIVNLSPGEPKLVALSTICTHLGCIPAWLQGDQKFKCPCHGSGYYIDGVNFEGPTPRPLERFSISKDADGYLVVDKSKVYRQELGEWTRAESFVGLG